ncbi:MAG: winged helix-turn-helix domain-containing protein [Candidatus Nanoarchaeia archaeon]|nr:winged helix-turn-helix domain-containing protein [Candidatus Nanoarchaeia archaeon]MDD5499479.1 winged helix-turn-helix domain-containing protein [Candidatus Nanoarchaeia archaeon]
MERGKLLLKILKILRNKPHSINELVVNAKDKKEHAIKRLINDKLIIKTNSKYLITELGRKILDDYKNKRNFKELYEYLDAKICIKCGHKACMICKTWCDAILEDGTLCCNGECTYEEE